MVARKREIPLMKVLSDSEVEKIHNASLEVLTSTGIQVLHEEALKKLDDLGCKVDFSSKRVVLKNEIIEDAVKKIPKSFVMAGRNPKYDVLGDLDHVCARPLGGPDVILDWQNDEWRKTVLKDVVEWAVLVQNLPYMDYGMIIYPNDVHLDTRDVRATEVMIEHTEKHIQLQPLNARSVHVLAEIGAVIQGSAEKFRERPLVSMLVASLTPLCYQEDDVEMYKVCGQYGIPVMLNSSPQAGATGPVTLSGTAVILNAEILAANTLVQILGPGTPVVYMLRPMVLDMLTTMPSTGYVEVGLMGAMTVQMARRYGFVTDVLGPVTDAKIVGAQATMEKTYNTLLQVLAGGNIISGAGQLEADGLASPVQMVIDDDLMGSVLRVLKGAKVDEESLATKVIDEVGPASHFLDTIHTLNHFKDEYYRSPICNRENRNIWDSKGRQTIIDAARLRTRKILEEHKPVPMEKHVLEEIRAIVKKFET